MQIIDTLKIYCKITLTDLEKIIKIDKDDLKRYLRNFLYKGDLNLKIDEFNDEVEFFMENNKNVELKRLTSNYENMNNLQLEVIDYSVSFDDIKKQ